MRIFRFRRSCPNCKAEWPGWRYCEDCWRMIAKTVATVLLSELATWLLHRFVF